MLARAESHHAVGANSEAAVTDMLDLPSAELGVAIAAIENHKIVASAVIFKEMYFH